ncbi:hypothetical protein ERO13_A01G042333v2 [Gossypium hirsutum]|uniref:Uncharacterized protein n=1 Tax=Gossypium darwinii TaxID=34276 RepID=A0A5D2HI61_GOSDA|nr:hypothetical protein ERO13_A01G042333v2 [Gossypium hirsutum]TYH29808.1 hypothetical protein ES288_A01G041600v1 [Gossypium darwinii]
MWVKAVYNDIILTESSWWFCPLKCRSHNKTYKGLEMSWRFPPRSWLKFNVCGVVFEDKAGGGGVLRDEDRVARALFSSPSEAKDAELAELKSTGVTLELYEGMGWATCCPLLIEVGSNVVFKWLSKTKVEHMGNKMTFAPAITKIKRFDTFKPWGFCRIAFIGFGRVYCMLQVFETGMAWILYRLFL